MSCGLGTGHREGGSLTLGEWSSNAVVFLFCLPCDLFLLFLGWLWLS